MTSKLFKTLFLFFFCSSLLAQNKDFHLWAETPPMGWNSYDCFGAAVNEAEIKGNARMMGVHLKDAVWHCLMEILNIKQILH